MAQELGNEKKRAISYLIFSYYHGDLYRAAKGLSLPKDVLEKIYEEGSAKASEDFDRLYEVKKMEVNARVEAERRIEQEKDDDRVNLKKLKNKALKRIEDLVETCEDPSKIATAIKVIDDLEEKRSAETDNSNSVYEFIKKSRRK